MGQNPSALLGQIPIAEPLSDTKTGASLRPLSDVACMVIQSQPRNGDVVFASRSGEMRIVGSEDVVEDRQAR